MNKQALFDDNYRAFVIQELPFSYDKGCKYRGPNGTKCGIGRLIPDEVYTPKMEGCCVGTLFTNNTAQTREGMEKVFETTRDNERDMCFLESLQQCHDSAAAYNNREHAERMYKELAADYGLTIPQS